MNANDTQIDGAHYTVLPIQPWDYCIANRIGFVEGNIIKYITRWPAKHGIVDLRKAKHCIEKLIEVEEARLAALQKKC